MADEKLAKLREAVAGLGQIRSGTPFAACCVLIFLWISIICAFLSLYVRLA
jgi:hypothetical protein